MCITIIAPQITARLLYTFDWIFVEQLGLRYQVVTREQKAQNALLTIDYTNTFSSFSIPNLGLLFQSNIERQNIEIGQWNELPTLFAARNIDCKLPFDLFSAVFYLISRHEEYLPFTPDMHSRFPATDSVLFSNNLLDRPIVDEWIFALGKVLEENGIKIKQKQFEFLPSYDIDIAWSYKNKGLKRTLGGYFKSFVGNGFSAVRERTAVLFGKIQDPYFSFGSTNVLHDNYGLKPLYFVLAAAQNGPFDKHILPSNKNMRLLLQGLSAKYKIGMHPSYNTNEHPDLFVEEQQILADIIGQRIDISRQHYIKFSLPETYRRLIAIGVQQDYSMGYGTHLGFRAGTSRPFFWYDLQADQQTELQVFPFCFMDTTAHFEMKLSTKEAFDKLYYFKDTLQKNNGLMLTVFHNFSLGTDKEWEGWAEAYADFIKK
jgi:hypothetical protein